MKATSLKLAIPAVVLAVLGCATTDDPRQGGLFGYNPAAYERRIAEREAKLSSLKDEEADIQQNTAQLNDDLSRRQADRDEAARRLSAMNRQIDAIEEKISAVQVQTAAQQREYETIDSRLDRVKRQVLDAKNGNDATKRQEIERLNAEIDRLLEEADALSSM